MRGGSAISGVMVFRRAAMSYRQTVEKEDAPSEPWRPQPTKRRPRFRSSAHSPGQAAMNTIAP
jgi:hypothetical protein